MGAFGATRIPFSILPMLNPSRDICLRRPFLTNTTAAAAAAAMCLKKKQVPFCPKLSSRRTKEQQRGRWPPSKWLSLWTETRSCFGNTQPPRLQADATRHLFVRGWTLSCNNGCKPMNSPFMQMLWAVSASPVRGAVTCLQRLTVKAKRDLIVASELVGHSSQKRFAGPELKRDHTFWVQHRLEGSLNYLLFMYYNCSALLAFCFWFFFLYRATHDRRFSKPCVINVL